MDKQVEVKYNAGVKAQQAGEYKKALEYYRMALEIDKTHFESWLNAGSIYSKLGKTKKAIICYQRAILSRPDKRAFYNLAYEYFKSEQFAEAKRILEKVLIPHPDFLEAHLLLAYTYGKLGDNKAALHSVEKALQLDSDHRGALTAKALVLFHLQQFRQCEVLVNRLIAQFPNDVVLERLKASLLLEKDDPMASAKVLKKMVNHDPKLKIFQDSLQQSFEKNPEAKERIAKKYAEKKAEGVKSRQDLLDLSLLSFFQGDAEAAMDYLIQMQGD
ncbi:MAG: tetratricopeptide repeat protein [Candidatus Hydrogenedentota bacterium]|nr:MAG: tetratricopeptide repeat protein [Candidatus Hydrogenedentota bacterium]